MKQYPQYEFKGSCVICGRDMYNDAHQSIDQHHFIPKSRGGIEKLYIHKVCHQAIHAFWTVKELEQQYSDPEVIKSQDVIQPFLAWIKKKDPLFYEKTISSNEKKRKKRRG